MSLFFKCKYGMIVALPILMSFLLSSCILSSSQKSENDFNFPSVQALNSYLDSISILKNELERTSLIDSLWVHLKANRRIPFAVSDSVALLYKGDADSVAWAGDFTEWKISNIGVRVGKSNVWRCVKRYPSDSRIDYKIVLNGSNWVADPDNSYLQKSSFGENSELRMPDYIYPEIAVRNKLNNRGSLSSNLMILSDALKYSLNYKVYTPFGYNSLSKLPVIYVTDGHEYSDDQLGAMVIILDNLIHTGSIAPILAVFIDPRDVTTGKNRRLDEYNCNPKYAQFLANELVPVIDSHYKTNAQREARAILGTSVGGLNSAFIGAQKPNIFKLIALQSPAFWYNKSVLTPFRNKSNMDLKIFVSTGTISDTQKEALEFKTILENKAYQVKYLEINDGHSWGNWKSLVDEMLIYFFATK